MMDTVQRNVVTKFLMTGMVLATRRATASVFGLILYECVWNERCFA